MSTYMPKGKTERQWYVLDAEGRTLGEVAVEAAVLLRGKHKPTFAPHADCGDSVIIINAAKVVLTGKKGDQKFYRTHSGFPGGLKEVKYDRLMATKPELALRLAVRGMLPKNSIGRASLNRLKLFRGAEHTHAAQKPEVFTK